MITAAPLVAALAVPALTAQQTPVPVRAVTAPQAATTEPLRFPGVMLELSGGQLLVDLPGQRRLLIFDSTLSHVRVAADTQGSATPYPLGAKYVRYLGDSILVVDGTTRSLVMMDPSGNFGRVMAAPKPQDIDYLLNTGLVGADARGRLVYQGPPPYRPTFCRVVDGKPLRPDTKSPPDSIALIRADFETRSADTIARVKVTVRGFNLATVTDDNYRLLSASVHVDPSLPITDAWTMTSTGAIAIVRGHDYHVDWIDVDGSRSTPKLPFDWRRVTDDEKQAKIDSARRIVDSVTALGGYQLQMCGTGASFSASPPKVSGTDASGGRAGGGDPGAGPAACQHATASVVYPTIGEMADYIPPIRESSVRADRDGNIWILPTTSKGAAAGLLYDIVNGKGELVERVQLPPQRDIAGFGKGGVLYLSHRDAGWTVIERVRIAR